MVGCRHVGFWRKLMSEFRDLGFRDFGFGGF